MKAYIDGFVLTVPKKNVKAYTKMSTWAGKIWMDHGALQYIECVGDDLKGMPGCLPFPKLAKVKSGETVVFSWIMYKSKKHRDAVNAKVMKDPRMTQKMPAKSKMPFDLKKMAYGGFSTIVMF